MKNAQNFIMCFSTIIRQAFNYLESEDNIFHVNNQYWYRKRLTGPAGVAFHCQTRIWKRSGNPDEDESSRKMSN